MREGKGDCSLSNYAFLTGHANYFNVTVDTDEGDKQRKIIDAILARRGRHRRHAVDDDVAEGLLLPLRLSSRKASSRACPGPMNTGGCE